MAKAPIARQLGDDYQAGLFWFHACRLFLPFEQVSRVGFELDQPAGFDDVSVEYAAPQPDGRGASYEIDYFQSKFHVAQTGAFRHESLIDPGFIGSTSTSLLQRLQAAHNATVARGVRCRFTVVSPWPIHPDDPLASLRDHTTDGFRLEHLADGKTVSSAMGNVRISWRQHLNLASDDDLYALLKAFRLAAGSWSFESLRAAVNERLYWAGFRPMKGQQISNPYDDLIAKAYYAGMREFDRQSLQELAEREGLWEGPPRREEDRPRVVAVRSFTRWTQQIADAADAFLDLAPLFSGRVILDDAHWSNHVLPQLAEFLESAVGGEHPTYDLHVDAHTSIAFAAGYALAKVPAVVTPVQRTGPSSSIRWSPAPARPSATALWSVTEHPRSGGEPGHLALALGVTHEVVEDVRSYLDRTGSTVGRVLEIVPSTGVGRFAVRDGAHAWALADELAKLLRGYRHQRALGSPLHVFASVPNALMFFVGQHAPAFGPCQLYEYDYDGGVLGAYSPSLRLPTTRAQDAPAPEGGIRA
jgi:hypothetical protein